MKTLTKTPTTQQDRYNDDGDDVGEDIDGSCDDDGVAKTDVDALDSFEGASGDKDKDNALFITSN